MVSTPALPTERRDRYAPLVANRLTGASSAYLRQHADQPVDWWPWGAEPFEEARRRDVPVFLSVGYAACHWCHVMAHESFDDPEVADALNRDFVAIKVDREERPDVDAIYMAATVASTGQGGWPMSVFLLPDRRPFLAGTYFPPVDRGGIVGFPTLLHVVSDAWRHRRAEVVTQAEEFSDAVERHVSVADRLAPVPDRIEVPELRRRLRASVAKRITPAGGLGGAPLFPRPSLVLALAEGEASERASAFRVLDAMSHGGLYDHLDGGFARYCVDDEWRVPHFEKMLSDQSLLAEAYAILGRRHDVEEWRAVARSTLDFVVRRMEVAGGFASSLDADADGVEGGHVVWSPDVAAGVLDARPDADAARTRWNLHGSHDINGGWVPRLAPAAPFRTPTELLDVEDALRNQRSLRTQPGRDDKVVLEFNSMLARSLFATGDADDARRGRELLDQLAATHGGTTWWRTADHGAPATAGDLAWYVDALVSAYEVDGDDRWIDRATVVADYLLDHHWDGERPRAGRPDVGGGVFLSADGVTDVPWRVKDVTDGSVPSSYAITARSLARLALVTGDLDRLSVAQRLVGLLAALAGEQPAAVPDLIEAAGFAFEGVQVVVPGGPHPLTAQVRSLAVPRTVLITGSGRSPLLEGRREGWAYVCVGTRCSLPLADGEALRREIEAAL